MAAYPGSAEDDRPRWQCLTVPGWYGEGDRVIEVCPGTAVWYHTGLPPVPIRWVLIRDPPEHFDSQALLCTDRQQNPLTIVSWFVRRWPVEVTFQEVRATLGGNRNDRGVRGPSREPPHAGWLCSRS
jgi:hypothetical protein